MAKTEDLVDYVERAFDPITAENFTPVDSLILSWASYFRVDRDVPEVATPEGARIRDLLRAEAFPTYFSTLWDPPKSKRLLLAMGSSPRFRDVIQCRSVDEVDTGAQKQFAASTYVLGEDLVYVAFRGTDRTLVGWKEDFNMTFRFPVPAQEDAAAYLGAVAASGARILVGGHSKGGNLAIAAAAANLDRLGDRLLRVYSHDGPGFLGAVLARPEFVGIADRIDKTVPQSSVVGMLLDHSVAYGVVRSTRVGLWQHDPFSWVVSGGDFERLEGLTIDARHIQSTIASWLASHDEAEREAFIDAVYDLVTVPGATTVSDLVGSWQTTIPEIRERLAAMDPQTRAFVLQTFREVASIGLHRIPPTLRELLPQRSARRDDAASGPADRSSPQSPDAPDTVAELSGVPSRMRRRARVARAEERAEARGSGIALIGRARARRAVEGPGDSAPELGNEGAAGP